MNDLCKEKGVLIIVDEVQSGFGRCGALFAHELFGIDADIMTVAKGIGGGFPMAAFLAKEDVTMVQPLQEVLLQVRQQMLFLMSLKRKTLLSTVRKWENTSLKN